MLIYLGVCIISNSKERNAQIQSIEEWIEGIRTYYNGLISESISLKTLDSLLEYSISIPSRAVPGKVWKRNLLWHWPKLTPLWVLCEFVIDEKDKNMLVVESRKLLIKKD